MKKRRKASKSKINNLDKLISLGKKKGHLTYEEVNSILPDDITSSDEID